MRAVINGAEPVGLIELGCPEDEYDPEVEETVRSRQPLDADMVLGVFSQWFGEDGRMERRMAEEIADAVNRAR